MTTSPLPRVTRPQYSAPSVLTDTCPLDLHIYRYRTDPETGAEHLMRFRLWRRGGGGGCGGGGGGAVQVGVHRL